MTLLIDVPPWLAGSVVATVLPVLRFNPTTPFAVINMSLVPRYRDWVERFAPKETAMRFRHCILFVALLAVAGTPAPQVGDYSTITCRDFLASGRANMAALISFLWGYHAGKTGILTRDRQSPYGARLGYYCKTHPAASLLDSSERVLSELDAHKT